MKVLILAGGYGTRLGNYTKRIPKPLIIVKNIPLIIYIMNIYKKFGYNDFIVAGGYKYKKLKNFFYSKKNFNVKVVNTGLNTLTGKRIKLLEKYIDTSDFFLTYGDGLANIDIKKLVAFHLSHKKIGTISAVHPPSRFGELKFGRSKNVLNFEEKPQVGNGWINGGFFVLKKTFFKYLDKKNVMLERGPLQKLIKKKQLKVFAHKGAWMCVDTQRDHAALTSKINLFK